MSTLVFDIETVPDVEFGRRYLALDGLGDEDVAQAMFALRRERTGNDFLPLHQQRVVAISCALRSRDGFRLWSLGDPEAGEAELVARFFDGIERFSPELVSWNGSGFDLPVLHYRALRHGIAAPRYWEVGDEVREFRYNNYLGRFHWRHIDLMDVLAGFQLRGAARLDEVAVLLGLPGKIGLSGALVWDAWCNGRIGAIRDYCETDVLNTWLVFLQFEQFRGRRSAAEVEAEQQLVAETLRTDGRAHLAEFLAAWGRA
ncbi:MAG TPA: 3'-5' exonuclease [Gammaproteobacteria bacterium]|nr:3'-5' exonuclease [Gammaproteobacteria bacterium]